MANRLGCVPEDMVHIKNYVANIEARPAFQKAISMGETFFHRIYRWWSFRSMKKSRITI